MVPLFLPLREGFEKKQIRVRLKLDFFAFFNFLDNYKVQFSFSIEIIRTSSYLEFRLCHIVET